MGPAVQVLIQLYGFVATGRLPLGAILALAAQPLLQGHLGKDLSRTRMMGGKKEGTQKSRAARPVFGSSTMPYLPESFTGKVSS